MPKKPTDHIDPNKTMTYEEFLNMPLPQSTNDALDWLEWFEKTAAENRKKYIKKTEK